jgi:glycosyltransferase involved in cell wall biosynthesis
LKVSGIITTFNEEKNIIDCIKSLFWCDEILVVDSFSTDQTIQLTKSFEKIVVLHRKYYGSASQKKWAMYQDKN